MPKTRQSSFLFYGIAVLSAIAAALLTWSMWPLLQRCVFLFFILAVMLSAWRGGHGPGLVATALSTLLSDYFFFPPLHTIGPFDSHAELAFFIFVPVALLVSIFTAESRRARRGLAETTETLKAIINASPLALIAVDKDGAVRTWNPAAERIFGWSATEVIGGPNPIIPEDKLEEYRQIREQSTMSSGFIVRETVRLRKDGSRININLSTAGVRDNEGILTGSMAVIADITEQKQAVEALRESEQRFRATFEQAALGIVQLTRDGKLAMVNQRFCDFLGYSESELLGMNVIDITRPEDRNLSLRNIEELWAGDKQASTFEKFYIRKDGSLMSANLTASVVRDITGNPLYFIGAIEDTTDRMVAEKALRESEERFRAIFEHAAVGIAQVAVDGRWVMVNQHLCDMLGYTKAELTNRTFQEVTEQGDIEASLLGRQALLAGELETYALEKRYVHKDGSVVWAHLSLSVVRDALGNPESLLGVIEDISARKKAEEALVRLATAVEQAVESIVITDTAGTIQYVNPAFEYTTGYSRDEAIGQNPRILNSGKQDPSFYSDMWNSIAGGDVWTGRFINRKKDGTLYEEEATISPVRDASGKVVNFVAVKRDVTKEVGLETQLMQAQKMEAVGQLAGGIAHDFNNLLTAVIGYSQLALVKLDDSNPMRADIIEIEKAGLRAAELTGQLLTFSRKQVFHPKNLALNALITDLQKMLKRLIGEDIDMIAVLDLELGTVKADPGQLQQVIMNLIVNARDAMPNGGKLTIETANVELDGRYAAQHIEVIPGAYCMLAISDNGCGMDEQIRSHIFEPFFTTKSLGHGTGLGLSTVYGIVKQSGGSISVYSEPGHGTTFRVYLPRVVERADEDESETIPMSLPMGEEALLLVEDEDAVRDFAARVLREHGYTVLEAADAECALRVIEEHSPDEIQLLVTDVVMPRMSGPELVEQLAPLRPDLRVLFVSGYTDRAIIQNGVLAEGIPLLQKPFTVGTLVRKVREVLDAPVGAKKSVFDPLIRVSSENSTSAFSKGLGTPSPFDQETCDSSCLR